MTPRTEFWLLPLCGIPCAGARANKRINLMRHGVRLDWERTAHRLCAKRWADERGVYVLPPLPG